MNVAKWVRSCFLAAALSFIASAPAHAYLVWDEKSIAGALEQVFDYSFIAPDTGTVDIELADLHPFGTSFIFLGYTIDAGASILSSSPIPGTFPGFAVTAGTEYFLSVYAKAGPVPPPPAATYFGKYRVVVGDVTPTPVPEPNVMLMMLAGIGLLGWMRLRKSENLS